MPESDSHPSDTPPTIFLLEEDDDAQRAFKANLRRYGFRVLVAVDMEDAFDWLSTGYIPADIVLVDAVGKTPEEALEVGRRLRDRAKYNGQTPLVVMAEKLVEGLEGTDVNVSGNDWVTYPEDGEQLSRLLVRLTGGRANPTNNGHGNPAPDDRTPGR
jgi:DNA-binding response OmpR family regulator